MRKLLLIALVFTFSFQVNAQVQAPQPSPFSKVEQKVGLTDVTFEYSRPGVKGRTVFGNMVPYGKLWRAGANNNTKITFSTDVTVDGQTLEAGSYAIYIIPNKENWEVFFYTDTANWGLPAKWDDAKVAAKTTVKVYELPFNVETFTIDINNLTNNGGTLEFIWEKTYAGVPFSVPTENAVLASIEKTMAGPNAGDYYAAASYYLEEGKDINQAKVWIDKVIELSNGEPKFWHLRKQALIYAKAGDKKGAIKAAKASLEGAKAAGNADYVKMNTESIAAWSK
ncbi:DUF2911 domain-containing protein [Oceanihabitans sediminis]|uniref:DUF2911 domain-containing protein n=1 Tax=Oceanihabitans sediminis TaxID=1812012 RepID=A0A368P2C9_9FLAO|nr:DUF2911 domain-containing protein [Oceanihabitans sediminis]MDX1277880.1 DUF2911 domain-containing protein [Oceanihabitans sediminis]MDX1774495.1 DUF2911 domain-containing protein [Oceanihabitans sediminis]RBP27781.1 DUF2911 family protein [Oceanihabitans sediminis]RCU56566.1 DUF2911 domain-containing protein [Oceanihabitans sediminis]